MSADSSPLESDPGEIYERRRLEDIAARWDSRAGGWDQALADPACHLNEDEAYRRFFAQLKPVLAARRDFCAAHGVIDAGCGTGLVLGEVGSAFAWGVGVDISPEMIRVAESKNIARATFVVADCFRLPETCPKAGAVVSRGILLSHYGPHQAEALLSACRSALVPGGFLFVDFLNEGGRAEHNHAPESKAWFRREKVLDLARRAGFARAEILGEDDRRVLLLLADNKYY